MVVRRYIDSLILLIPTISGEQEVGVATGCGCKEVYRFPHTTYPYSSCICSWHLYAGDKNAISSLHEHVAAYKSW